ncbi:MAG: paraquat-inducible protein A [Cellvibrionaceae bacterium]|nr:paraquat-inducible protein A [Cellvibrionaceae bacterium]
MLQLACEKCDQLLNIAPLKKGQKAVCPRCHNTLLHYHHSNMQPSFAYALAALVFLCLSLFYPFLGFSVSGQTQVMSLLETGSSLIAAREYLLGTLVIGLIIIAPLLLILSLLSLALLSVLGIRQPWVHWLGRVFYEIDHWNMVEVFVIGVLVALIKISSSARIELGLSFWAFIGFSVCLLLAVNTLNYRQLWHMIGNLRT